MEYDWFGKTRLDALYEVPSRQLKFAFVGDPQGRLNTSEV